MKLIISRNGQDAHLTLRGAMLVLALGGALIIAAVFDALLQRYLITNNTSSHGFSDLVKIQLRHDADFLRENVSLPMSKVGILQANEYR